MNSSWPGLTASPPSTNRSLTIPVIGAVTVVCAAASPAAAACALAAASYASAAAYAARAPFRSISDIAPAS